MKEIILGHPVVTDRAKRDTGKAHWEALLLCTGGFDHKVGRMGWWGTEAENRVLITV